VHPSYSGNVVKALGGAKQGYPVVSRVLERVRPASALSDGQFIGRLNEELRATVHEVVRLTPLIVEVLVKAPLAARRFRPGQFYRLQNFEMLAPRANGTRLTMEGIALTGAWVDGERGLISLIALEMGGSSDLCVLLKPGDPVQFKGPTGGFVFNRADPRRAVFGSATRDLGLGIAAGGHQRGAGRELDDRHVVEGEGGSRIEIVHGAHDLLAEDIKRAACRPPSGPAIADPGLQPTVTWAPWHFLYFLPEPHGQGSLRPTLASLLALGCGLCGPSTLGGAESSIREGTTRCWRRRRRTGESHLHEHPRGRRPLALPRWRRLAPVSLGP